jgi:prepilin-type N-terminal cleavage/methylation domain-containing protein
MMKSQRGFTLVEMMTVIAIVGVLVAVAFGVDNRTYGATAQSASDQITQSMSFARMRASATRRTHRVQVQPTQLTIYQATTTGLASPTAWQQIQVVTMPKGVTLWNAQTGALAGSGASPAQNASLVFPIDFRPDGQATAATVFVADNSAAGKYRVLVYHATGGSYARQYW